MGNYIAYGPSNWYSIGVQRPPASYVAPPDDRGASGTPPAQVTVGKSHTFPDIALLRAVDFAGAVVRADGKPAAKAVVNPCLMDFFSDRQSVVTDAQGRFVLKHVRPDDIIEPRIRLGNAVNRCVEFDPAELKTPVKIEISEKFAVRFRGRVTDSQGNPLAGARVEIGHNFNGVGRNSSYGLGNIIGEVRTGPDGRFESPGLWAKDDYHFKARVERYGDAESKRLCGEAGSVREVPTIVLTRSAGAVAGTVVGLGGKPVAGATVFGVDGPRPFSTITKADGRFTLQGFFDAPGFIFAKKDGYRMTAVPVTPGGQAIAILLRTLAEPPAPAPRITPEHGAAERELIQKLLTALWKVHDKYGYERSIVSDMARIDLDKAKAWRDDELKRTDDKVDLTDVFDREIRRRTLFDLARKDLDEALEILRGVKGRGAFDETLELGKRLLSVDPKKAERLAEEAVILARKMMLPQKVWSLAEAGELAIRAGNKAGGAKVIGQAADLAEKMETEHFDGLARGMVAARLAPIDWPRAKKLLDSFKEPSDYNRYLHNAAGQLAYTDLAKAKKLLAEFRPGNDFYPHSARLLIASRIAKDHPDEAVALVEGTGNPVYRAKGLLQLAGHLAPTDRKRAIALIDRAFDEVEKDPHEFSRWSNSGGPAGMAAFGVYRAKEIGHPDVAALVARTLTLRNGRDSSSPKDNQNNVVRVAAVLALTDPAAARQLLAAIAPPDQFVQRAADESREWLFALALADPTRAIALMDRQLASLAKYQGNGNALGHTGLVELGSILTSRNRLADLGMYGVGFHDRDDDD